MKTFLLLTLCVVALVATPLFAEEGDPLRGKIKELEERARTAKEQGKADEAQRMMEQVQQLHAEMRGREEQRGGGEKHEMARRRIEELRKAGKHEEAQQLEHRSREEMAKQGDEKDGSGGAERTAHIRQAIQHLHAAGLQKPAERIGQMLHQQDHEQMQQSMREMQGQTQRALRETHEQMAKMARAIEELRGQAGKQRGEGERRKD